MKNVIIRSLSGIIYIILIVGAILLGPIWMASLLTVFGLIALRELEIMAGNPMDSLFDHIILFVDAVAMASMIWVSLNSVTPVMCAVIILFALCVRIILAIYDHEGHAAKSFLSSIGSVVYIGLPLCALMTLYQLGENTYYYVLAMFILIWINDTGAFCAGSLFGRHRLFPRLSPKKSWEGFFGGLVFCMGFGALCSCFSSWQITLLNGLVLGVVVSIAATYGDLFESLIKREAGVKDAGNIIPGHGGVLDRIDSLLLVAPLTLLYYILTI